MTTSTQQRPGETNWQRSDLKYGFFLEIKPNENLRDVQADSRYIELFLNPDRHVVSEPAATAIKPTQAGSFVSSNGWFVIKHDLSGQTGMQPGNGVSGQTAFWQLDNLYRLWKDRTRANQYAVMHWFAIKEDEFWVVEIENFRLTRTSKAPIQYRYDLSFTATEPSVRFAQRTAAAVDVTPTVIVKDTRSTLTELTDVLDRGRVVLPLVAGQLRNAYQQALSSAGVVVSTLSDLEDSAKAITTDLVINLLRQTSSFFSGVFTVLARVKNLPEEVEFEVNRCAVETSVLVDVLLAFHELESSQFGLSGIDGSVRTSGAGLDSFRPIDANQQEDLVFQVPADSVGRAATEDFIAQVPDIERYLAAKMLKSVTVRNGQALEDVALEHLGSVHAAIVLSTVNDLVYPYIVPDAANKPPGTVAWGENLYVPVLVEPDRVSTDGRAVATLHENRAGVLTAATTLTLTDTNAKFPPDLLVGYTVQIGSTLRVIVANTATTLSVNRAYLFAPLPGTAYTVVYREFTLQKQDSREVLTYGKDALVREVHVGVGTETYFDTVIGPNNDLQLVYGYANFDQAMTIMLNTEQGSYKLHPTYGLNLPVGLSMSQNKSELFVFDAKRSLARNTKVESVPRIDVQSVGDVLKADFYIKPIAEGRARLFRRAS